MHFLHFMLCVISKLGNLLVWVLDLKKYGINLIFMKSELARTWVGEQQLKMCNIHSLQREQNLYPIMNKCSLVGVYCKVIGSHRQHVLVIECRCPYVGVTNTWLVCDPSWVGHMTNSPPRPYPVCFDTKCHFFHNTIIYYCCKWENDF